MTAHCAQPRRRAGPFGLRAGLAVRVAVGVTVRVTVGGVLGMGIGPALAHHAWLLPSNTVLNGNDSQVSVLGAVSEDLFEFDTNALALDGLVVTGPDGQPVNVDQRSQARRVSSAELNLARTGTYRIANVTEQVMVSYTLGSETKRWRGSPQAYAAFAKELPAGAQDLRVNAQHARVETFVSRGRAEPFSVQPVGQGLELLPLTPPTDLSAGDRSRFQLLLDGRPAAGIEVTVLRGGNRYRYKMGEISATTDAQGRFSVQWPEAGRYWLGASHGRRPAEAGAGGGAGGGGEVPRRSNYSATFEVLPP